MKIILGGALAGLFFGLLILVLGVAVVTWVAISVSVAVIVGGAFDYVRSHQ